jgi:hypothetical protein
MVASRLNQKFSRIATFNLARSYWASLRNGEYHD